MHEHNYDFNIVVSKNLSNHQINYWNQFQKFPASAMRKSVDIEELVDDFATFYIAGQETTSNLLTFSLVLTLQNPNVLER